MVKASTSSVMILCLIACMHLLSCQKEKDEEEVPASPNYAPMTAGSTWTYQTNAGDSYTVTATSRDTVAMGRTYRVFTNSDGPNHYLAKSANEYFRFGVITGLSANGFEELYLKDNQDVNASWQSTQTATVPGIPFPLVATLKYTIKEKGINRNVNNRAFSNVMHIRLDVSVANIGSVGGGDFYYADKVGLIESFLNISVGGQSIVNSSEMLTAYSIK